MTELDTRYRVTTPNVIHRVIDDEVVIIDLDTGNYFTLLGTATDIWDHLDRGLSIAEIVDALQTSYSGEPSAIHSSVSSVVAELIRDGLITQTDDLGATEFPTPRPPDGKRVPFTEPVVERYDDMQDLIRLDPVHEIDESQGWPKKAPEGT